MLLTQLADSSAQLTYALFTNPSPVSVSPEAGPPAVASLTFVISAPIGTTATVTEIAFNLPIGDPSNPDSTDLTETAAGISPSVSSSGADQWQIGPGAAPGSFVLAPAAGGSGVVEGQGLTVTFTGIQVSPVVGTAVISIVEVTALDDAPAATGQVSVAVPKFPAAFYAGNFTASSPVVPDGQPVTLTWIGSSAATYTLLWSTQSLDVSDVRQWTSPNLTDTTTFFLEVSAQQDGQTVKLYFSLTIVVANPNLVATTLDVLQTTTLEGPVTVGSAAATASLAVNGPATISGSATLGATGVTGGLQADSLAVAGDTSTNTLEAAALTVSGNASLGATTAAQLTIGSWVISVDVNGNLNFSNGSANFQIGAGGNVSCGPITSNGYAVICDQSPITIFAPSWNAYLNGSDHFGGGCNGWDASAYWMDAGNPPDGDSNLTIGIGNPF